MVTGHLYLSFGAISLGGVVSNELVSPDSSHCAIQTLIPKKFLDQINVRHDHTSATVPLASKLIHSIPGKRKSQYFKLRIANCTISTHLECPRREAAGNAPKDLRQPVAGKNILAYLSD